MTYHRKFSSKCQKMDLKKKYFDQLPNKPSIGSPFKKKSSGSHPNIYLQPVLRIRQTG